MGSTTSAGRVCRANGLIAGAMLAVVMTGCRGAKPVVRSQPETPSPAAVLADFRSEVAAIDHRIAATNDAAVLARLAADKRGARCLAKIRLLYIAQTSTDEPTIAAATDTIKRSFPNDAVMGAIANQYDQTK